jgi:hypothetical protein
MGLRSSHESQSARTRQSSDTGKLTHNPGEIGVIDKLSRIIESLLGKGDNQPLVPIADNLLLTIAEAQAKHQGINS